MANTAQSKKRARQGEKRRQHNTSLRARFRTAIKKVQAAIGKGDKSAAQDSYRDAVSVIDKTASKGLIHDNKAARHKSRLNEQIRTM